MIFENREIPKPKNIEFNWCADYYDGTSFTEFNMQTGVANSFYTVLQRNTVRFGLFGQGMKFFFENASGTFNLNGRRIDIGYEIEGKLHMLTCDDSSKDFITYKEASANFSGRSGTQRSNIDSFNFGYKTTYEKDEVKFKFQPVVSLPNESSTFIEVKLTSMSKVDGDLVFFSKSKEVERFHAPIEEGMSGTLKWTVK